MTSIQIPYAAHPEPDVICGGQPAFVQFQVAREAGVRTVINIRARGEAQVAEQARMLPRMGFVYYHLPIDSSADLTLENARRFAALVDCAARPLIVHCASGNRVGAMAALRAFHVDGVDAEAALRIGRAWGLTALEPVVRAKLTR